MTLSQVTEATPAGCKQPFLSATVVRQHHHVGIMETWRRPRDDWNRNRAGACNVHFADSMTGGRLDFDYRLRPGVVQTSYALDVLRSVVSSFDAAVAQNSSPDEYSAHRT